MKTDSSVSTRGLKKEEVSSKMVKFLVNRRIYVRPILYVWYSVVVMLKPISSKQLMENGL